LAIGYRFGFCALQSMEVPQARKEDRRHALTKAFQSDHVLQTQYRSIPGLRRASLGKTFIDMAWPELEQVFARVVLINVFAIYEGWLDDLMDELHPNRSSNHQWSKKFITACQFHYRNSRHEDWAWAMAEFKSAKVTKP
jgi:hypothetical protein